MGAPDERNDANGPVLVQPKSRAEIEAEPPIKSMIRKGEALRLIRSTAEENRAS